MDTLRFERLLAPHYQAALGFARCLCRSQSDGDDLFQVALMRALDRLAGLRDEAAFKPWLYRILVTSHRNSLRRSFWRRVEPLGDHDRAGGEAIDEVLGGADRAQRALAALPPEQREAIVLFEIEGWSIEEIAEVQACSLSAVKSRLARGRDRLRDVYTRRLGGAPATTRLLPGGTR